MMVPDAKTLWRFREGLKSAQVFDWLFGELSSQIAPQGYITRKGQIMDASGLARARIKIGMMNLVYNLRWLAWLKAHCFLVLRRVMSWTMKWATPLSKRWKWAILGFGPASYTLRL